MVRPWQREAGDPDGGIRHCQLLEEQVMRITPLDVRKQEFRKAVRGFDCDEVRAFLTTLADEYETVLVDNKQLRERAMEQEERITEYKSMERTLRDTLMTAERLMQDTRETATREGEVIIQEAHLQARRVLEECRLRTEELRREISGLRKEKETYLGRFKSLAESQIQFIDAHRHDFEDLDKRLVDMVDSVVAGADNHAAQAEGNPQNEVEQVADAVQTAQDEVAASTTETPVPASAGPRSWSTGDVDVWRDYDPGAKSPTEQPQANTEPGAAPQEIPEPVAEIATAPSPEPVANRTDDSQWSPVGAAAVDMAAMGIPIPAVPAKTEDPRYIMTVPTSDEAKAQEPVFQP